MKEKTIVITIALFCGIINWFLVSLLESIAFDKSYLSTLIYIKSDVLFIYRLVMIAFFLLIGLLIIFVLKRRRIVGNELLKFKKAADSSGEVIFMTDTDGLIKYINSEFTNVYGFSAEEVIDITTPRILKSGVMNEQDYKYYWETILSGNVVKGELINKTKDGQIIHIEGSANPIYNDKEIICGFLAIQRDINERKRSEERLNESEKTTRALLNAPGDPAYLIDTDGLIISINESGLVVISKSVENLIGKCIYDFAGEHSIFDKSGKVSQVLESGKPHSYTSESDGVYYESTIYPLFGIDGKVNRLAIFEKNITKQKKYEQEIKERSKFLHSVIEALPHPFFVINVEDYSIALANSATKLNNFSTGIKCYQLTHAEDQPCSGTEHTCPIKEVVATGKPFVTMHIHYNEDNEPRNIEIYAYPIFDDDNNVVQMIEYTLDVTERSKAEEKINQLIIELQTKNDNQQTGS
ncbi:MAG: PAS domain-containing protein [Candidatus Kapabacteria bacterium]|jgi:PAS domain S-box-containing protein|nr:PAS domain-containing protein [Candidatus Kapabacteria bacterium]